MSTTYQKAAGETLDYDVDFSRWLERDDVIVAASAVLAGSAATIDTTEFSETQVRVWVSGGDEGETANITVTAETQQGRTKEVCFRLRIRGCRC